MKKEIKKSLNELKKALSEAEQTYIEQQQYAKLKSFEIKQMMNNMRLVNRLCAAIEELGFIFFRSEAMFKSPEGLTIKVDNNKENKTVQFKLFNHDDLLSEVLIHRCSPCELVESFADKFKTQVDIELSIFRKKLEGQIINIDITSLQKLIK